MSLLERFSRGCGSRPLPAGGIAREGTRNFTYGAPGWPAVGARTRPGRAWPARVLPWPPRRRAAVRGGVGLIGESWAASVAPSAPATIRPRLAKPSVARSLAAPGEWVVEPVRRLRGSRTQDPVVGSVVR